MSSSGALQVESAQRAVPPIAPGRCSAAPVRQAQGARVAFGVESIGQLVPESEFSGRVHSVFAQACNLACNHTLLTVSASSLGNGPATLRLAAGAPRDLRNHFDVGERFRSREGRLRTSRVELDLLHAKIWRPADPGPSLPPARTRSHLRNARLRLDEKRAKQSNVLDGAAATSTAALADACRALDCEGALRHVDRLIGWGEGLTPAGDDFLVGLIAGLDALVDGDERRRRFRAALVAALASGSERTTPIAAHCLRLAARGHYGEPLIRVRNALLGADDDAVADAALGSALAVGATSGADTVSGLVAGLLAWLPSDAGAR